MPVAPTSAPGPPHVAAPPSAGSADRRPVARDREARSGRGRVPGGAPRVLRAQGRRLAEEAAGSVAARRGPLRGGRLQVSQGRPRARRALHRGRAPQRAVADLDAGRGPAPRDGRLPEGGGGLRLEPAGRRRRARAGEDLLRPPRPAGGGAQGAGALGVAPEGRSRQGDVGHGRVHRARPRPPVRQVPEAGRPHGDRSRAGARQRRGGARAPAEGDGGADRRRPHAGRAARAQGAPRGHRPRARRPRLGPLGKGGTRRRTSRSSCRRSSPTVLRADGLEVVLTRDGDTLPPPRGPGADRQRGPRGPLHLHPLQLGGDPASCAASRPTP